MDIELEEQIDELIRKTTKDLKTKVCRLINRYQSKLTKQHTRELKLALKGIPVKKEAVEKPRHRERKTSRDSTNSKKSSRNDKTYDDSESESDYYSE